MTDSPDPTQSFSLRPMPLSDYASFVDLMRETPGVVVRDADAPESVARYLERNPGLSFFVFADGRLIGGVMAGHDGRRGYLQHLLVHPDYRGRGIARALVERSLAALAAAGIAKTHIDVLRTNGVGLGFWERMGWQRRDDLCRYSFIRGAGDNA